MENVHNLDKKPWICPRKIHLKQLLPERISFFNANGAFNHVDRNSEVNANEKELLEELERFVRSNENEVKPHFLFNSADEKALVDDPNCKMKMYQLQLIHSRKMITDRAYKVSYLMRLRTTRRELLMRYLASSNRPVAESVPELIPTSSQSIIPILTVQIWPQPGKNARIKLEKEILFRADQCLTELRDQFKCPRDYGVPMDLSDNPEQAERIFRGELFKSGLFLIGNTFYNDMRDHNNTDLSANIIDWASKEVIIRGEHGDNQKVGRGIGPFQKQLMEEQKFEDLEFRLGCPYLYLHQGDCEHLFTISDIKYVADDPRLRKTQFPFVTATSIGRKADNLKCYMCKNRPPHWYTRNNNRLPIDPYFFCESCFHSFNYDKDKHKIGQFQAYLYTSTFGIPDSVVMATNK